MSTQVRERTEIVVWPVGIRPVHAWRQRATAARVGCAGGEGEIEVNMHHTKLNVCVLVCAAWCAN
jgi:hypothetical protein